MGPNGCGKSTLAKHINGLLLPTEGNVFVEGTNTKEEKYSGNIKRAVGMVFQNYALYGAYPSFSVIPFYRTF